jgi:phosphoribosylanthranilate isomerase
MVKIKICGITNKRDAIAAASLMPDMIGFVLYNGSKRYVEPKIVRDIVNELPDNILKVGVFVDENAEKVSEIARDCLLSALQFHGDEDPEYCNGFKDIYKVIKAFRIKDKNSLKGINDYDVDYYMLDTYNSKLKGGTGESFDWKIMESFEFLRPVILSGGLTPDNVRDAIEEFSPYGVDVSSGVEILPGKKDIPLMKKFVENVRRA